MANASRRNRIRAEYSNAQLTSALKQIKDEKLVNPLVFLLEVAAGKYAGTTMKDRVDAAKAAALYVCVSSQSLLELEAARDRIEAAGSQIIIMSMEELKRQASQKPALDESD